MKKVKDQLINGSFYPEIQPSRKKPILLHRKHIQNGVTAQKEIQMRGYKHLSKVSAVGETTTRTLRTISKSISSKFIYRFQFDPYFCEKSCLQELCQVFRNMKGLKDLNLVFRRLDRINESDIVLPFVIKQIRLTKLRFELPKTNNINNAGIINFAKMIGKCVTIKFFEEVITDLEGVADETFIHLPKNVHKNIYLEEFTVENHKLIKSNNQGGWAGMPKINVENSKSLRKMSISNGAKTSWSSTNVEHIYQSIQESRRPQGPPNLEHVSVRFSESFTIHEFLMMFSSTSPHLQKLAFCSLEFLGCGISDLEIVTLIRILSKMPKLKQLTFKVIQHPNISKDCISFLVKTLKQLPHLKKFDLYFRKLSLSDWEIHELLQDCSEIPNLKCALFKNESLHISQNITDE